MVRSVFALSGVAGGLGLSPRLVVPESGQCPVLSKIHSNVSLCRCVILFFQSFIFSYLKLLSNVSQDWFSLVASNSAKHL
jgi:hypothetical protein